MEEKERQIKLALIRVGIKCDHAGYSYLTDAISLALENPNLVENPQMLYKKVSEKYGNVTAFRVESNIRNAINYTYLHRGFNMINVMYGMEVLTKGHKPTIAEFIRLMVQYYTLGLFKQSYKFESFKYEGQAN